MKFYDLFSYLYYIAASPAPSSDSLKKFTTLIHLKEKEMRGNLTHCQFSSAAQEKYLASRDMQIALGGHAPDAVSSGRTVP